MEEVEKTNKDIKLLLLCQGAMLLAIKGIIESESSDNTWRSIVIVPIDKVLERVEERIKEMEKESMDKEVK